MHQRIVVIKGHPDPAGGHYAHALADAYAGGAQSAGHEVRRIDVARLEFSWLRNKQEHESGPVPPAIRESQETIRWASHIVILYPLWLGEMPALLKAFLEQLLRPGFAYQIGKGHIQKFLTGKSARIVVTMGMPAVAYRWYFGAHSPKALQRSILGFVGIKPVRATLIGMVEGHSKRQTARVARAVAHLGPGGSLSLEAAR